MKQNRKEIANKELLDSLLYKYEERKISQKWQL